MTDNKGPPSKSAVLRKLSSSAEKLREFGVRRIGLFGSVRAGRAREDSDIDLLVEFEPGRETFADLMGLHSFLTQLLRGKIDLVTVGGLSPYLGPHILREVEYAEGLH